MKQASEKPSRKLVVRAIGRLGDRPEIEVTLAATWGGGGVAEDFRERRK